ncbi:MAG: anthranilate synthase component II [Polyangiales bacterium]
MILVVDNYDSFTYNLVQYLGELGATVVVRRNDDIDMAALHRGAVRGVLISPGPGEPEGAGQTLAVIAACAGRIPVFGVCLGHQAIAHHFGANIVRAAQVMHGRTSPITHDGRGVFQGLPSPLVATRYHSLIVAPASMPACLTVTAETEAGEIMGLRHRSLPLEAVQFHPESFLSEHGHRLLDNWLQSLPQTPEAT